MPSRSLATALHEASHVVVGVALGLRFESAHVYPACAASDLEGLAVFWSEEPERLALAIMYAAGVAYERRAPGGDESTASHDARAVKRIVRTRHAFETCVTAAGAILESRATALKRVARALLERDLTADDVVTLTHGARRVAAAE